MAERLKNILAFDLASAASVTIPHGLNTGVTGPRPLAPDIIFVPSTELEVASDTINVTLTNRGASPISGSILVEAWHTIERAFADVNDEDLPVKPYIVVSPEGGNQPDQPPFDQVLFTIYARTAGSDTTGDGSLAKPYATFQRAVRDVPSILPPGAVYRIDITGITELLPSDYTLPAWKTPSNSGTPLPNIYTIFQPAVEIFAQPQPVAAIPLADTIINAGDVASVDTDAVSGLKRVNLMTPRASWTTANLKGKQVIDGNAAVNPVQNTVIAEVTTTSIVLCNASNPTFPLQIVEPSAHLHGSPTNSGVLVGMNIDSWGVTGVKITTDVPGTFGLFADGNGCFIGQMSELENPFIAQTSGAVFFTNQNRTVRCWVHGQNTILGGPFGFVQSLGDGILDGINSWLNTPIPLTIRRAVFLGCGPIEIRSYEPGGTKDGAASPHIVVQNTMVKGGLGDGFKFHGVKGHFTGVSVIGCAGNGIVANMGGGLLDLHNVGSNYFGAATPNLGTEGLVVDDGMQVVVDAATIGSAFPLAGSSANQIKVGSLAATSWAAFGALVPVNLPDYAGTAATGARLTKK